MSVRGRPKKLGHDIRNSPRHRKKSNLQLETDVDCTNEKASMDNDAAFDDLSDCPSSGDSLRLVNSTKKESENQKRRTRGAATSPNKNTPSITLQLGKKKSSKKELDAKSGSKSSPLVDSSINALKDNQEGSEDILLMAKGKVNVLDTGEPANISGKEDAQSKEPGRSDMQNVNSVERNLNERQDNSQIMSSNLTTMNSTKTPVTGIGFDPSSNLVMNLCQEIAKAANDPLKLEFVKKMLGIYDTGGNTSLVGGLGSIKGETDDELPSINENKVKTCDVDSFVYEKNENVGRISPRDKDSIPVYSEDSFQADREDSSDHSQKKMYNTRLCLQQKKSPKARKNLKHFPGDSSSIYSSNSHSTRLRKRQALPLKESSPSSLDSERLSPEDAVCIFPSIVKEEGLDNAKELVPDVENRRTEQSLDPSLLNLEIEEGAECANVAFIDKIMPDLCGEVLKKDTKTGKEVSASLIQKKELENSVFPTVNKSAEDEFSDDDNTVEIKSKSTEKFRDSSVDSETKSLSSMNKRLNEKVNNETQSGKTVILSNQKEESSTRKCKGKNGKHQNENVEGDSPSSPKISDELIKKLSTEIEKTGGPNVTSTNSKLTSTENSSVGTVKISLQATKDSGVKKKEKSRNISNPKPSSSDEVEQKDWDKCDEVKEMKNTNDDKSLNTNLINATSSVPVIERLRPKGRRLTSISSKLSDHDPELNKEKKEFSTVDNSTGETTKFINKFESNEKIAEDRSVSSSDHRNDNFGEGSCSPKLKEKKKEHTPQNVKNYVIKKSIDSEQTGSFAEELEKLEDAINISSKSLSDLKICKKLSSNSGRHITPGYRNNLQITLRNKGEEKPVEEPVLETKGTVESQRRSEINIYTQKDLSSVELSGGNISDFTIGHRTIGSKQRIHSVRTQEYSESSRKVKSKKVLKVGKREEDRKATGMKCNQEESSQDDCGTPSDLDQESLASTGSWVSERKEETTLISATSDYINSRKIEHKETSSLDTKIWLESRKVSSKDSSLEEGFRTNATINNYSGVLESQHENRTRPLEIPVSAFHDLHSDLSNKNSNKQDIVSDMINQEIPCTVMGKKSALLMDEKGTIFNKEDSERKSESNIEANLKNPSDVSQESENKSNCSSTEPTDHNEKKIIGPMECLDDNTEPIIRSPSCFKRVKKSGTRASNFRKEDDSEINLSCWELDDTILSSSMESEVEKVKEKIDENENLETVCDHLDLEGKATSRKSKSDKSGSPQIDSSNKVLKPSAPIFKTQGSTIRSESSSNMKRSTEMCKKTEKIEVKTKVESKKITSKQKTVRTEREPLDSKSSNPLKRFKSEDNRSKKDKTVTRNEIKKGISVSLSKEPSSESVAKKNYSKILDCKESEIKSKSVKNSQLHSKKGSRKRINSSSPKISEKEKSKDWSSGSSSSSSSSNKSPQPVFSNINNLKENRRIPPSSNKTHFPCLEVTKTPVVTSSLNLEQSKEHLRNLFKAMNDSVALSHLEMPRDVDTRRNVITQNVSRSPTKKKSMEPLIQNRLNTLITKKEGTNYLAQGNRCLESGKLSNSVIEYSPHNTSNISEEKCGKTDNMNRELILSPEKCVGETRSTLCNESDSVSKLLLKKVGSELRLSKRVNENWDTENDKITTQRSSISPDKGYGEVDVREVETSHNDDIESGEYIGEEENEENSREGSKTESPDCNKNLAVSQCFINFNELELFHQKLVHLSKRTRDQERSLLFLEGIEPKKTTIFPEDVDCIVDGTMFWHSNTSGGESNFGKLNRITNFNKNKSTNSKSRKSGTVEEKDVLGSLDTINNDEGSSKNVINDSMNLSFEEGELLFGLEELDYDELEHREPVCNKDEVKTGHLHSSNINVVTQKVSSQDFNGNKNMTTNSSASLKPKDQIVNIGNINDSAKNVDPSFPIEAAKTLIMPFCRSFLTHSVCLKNMCYFKHTVPANWCDIESPHDTWEVIDKFLLNFSEQIPRELLKVILDWLEKRKQIQCLLRIGLYLSSLDNVDRQYLCIAWPQVVRALTRCGVERSLVQKLILEELVSASVPSKKLCDILTFLEIGSYSKGHTWGVVNCLASVEDFSFPIQLIAVLLLEILMPDSFDKDFATTLFNQIFKLDREELFTLNLHNLRNFTALLQANRLYQFNHKMIEKIRDLEEHCENRLGGFGIFKLPSSCRNNPHSDSRPRAVQETSSNPMRKVGEKISLDCSRIVETSPQRMKRGLYDNRSWDSKRQRPNSPTRLKDNRINHLSSNCRFSEASSSSFFQNSSSFEGGIEESYPSESRSSSWTEPSSPRKSQDSPQQNRVDTLKVWSPNHRSGRGRSQGCGLSFKEESVTEEYDSSNEKQPVIYGLLKAEAAIVRALDTKNMDAVLKVLTEIAKTPLAFKVALKFYNLLKERSTYTIYKSLLGKFQQGSQRGNTHLKDMLISIGITLVLSFVQEFDWKAAYSFLILLFELSSEIATYKVLEGDFSQLRVAITCCEVFMYNTELRKAVNILSVYRLTNQNHELWRLEGLRQEYSLVKQITDMLLMQLRETNQFYIMYYFFIQLFKAQESLHQPIELEPYYEYLLTQLPKRKEKAVELFDLVSSYVDYPLKGSTYRLLLCYSVRSKSNKILRKLFLKATTLSIYPIIGISRDTTIRLCSNWVTEEMLVNIDEWFKNFAQTLVTMNCPSSGHVITISIEVVEVEEPEDLPEKLKVDLSVEAAMERLQSVMQKFKPPLTMAKRENEFLTLTDVSAERYIEKKLAELQSEI